MLKIEFSGKLSSVYFKIINYFIDAMENDMAMNNKYNLLQSYKQENRGTVLICKSS